MEMKFCLFGFDGGGIAMGLFSWLGIAKSQGSLNFFAGFKFLAVVE